MILHILNARAIVWQYFFFIYVNNQRDEINRIVCAFLMGVILLLPLADSDAFNEIVYFFLNFFFGEKMTCIFNVFQLIANIAPNKCREKKSHKIWCHRMNWDRNNVKLRFRTCYQRLVYRNDWASNGYERTLITATIHLR